MLDACYRQVFFADANVVPIKTFDDCLADFYLYLLEAKPKRVSHDVEGYYLQQVRDEKALPEWLRSTFRHFLLQEHKILSEMQEALAEYRQQLATQRPSPDINLTLMHVAFALAWFNQHESELDRYLFFRSAYKHFSGFYEWPDEELNDADVAMILQITPGNLRTRTSRLCDKVRRLVSELNDAAIATLNRFSLDIAHSIYRTPDPDIEAILTDLLDKAERQLPQYAQIVALRKEKRRSMRVIPDLCACEESPSIQFSLSIDYSSRRSPRTKRQAPGSIPMPDYCPVHDDLDINCFEERSIPARPQNRIVALFKELIGLA